MYRPQNDDLDFEMGAFGDRLKRGLKKGAGALTKVTDATIVKPSAFIGGAIGGKKGRELGKKLGGITATATKIGVGAGVAGAALPVVGAIAPVGVPVATALVGRKLLGGKARLRGRVKVKARAGASAKVKRARKPKRARKQACGYVAKHPIDNALAAKVAAKLVGVLGGPIQQANRALRLAELQRTATYEHKRLMSDADFRKKVLAGIASSAADGNKACQRTIRVLVQR